MKRLKIIDEAISIAEYLTVFLGNHFEDITYITDLTTDAGFSGSLICQSKRVVLAVRQPMLLPQEFNQLADILQDYRCKLSRDWLNINSKKAVTQPEAKPRFLKECITASKRCVVFLIIRELTEMQSTQLRIPQSDVYHLGREEIWQSIAALVDKQGEREKKSMIVTLDQVLPFNKTGFTANSRNKKRMKQLTEIVELCARVL